ncbi:MAG: putative zinc-binding metallopeptidase [Muribaculaceae bacterium]|nr:putative zinc-binding metallopeptidase [Muribaculaceae bacterium]
MKKIKFYISALLLVAIGAMSLPSCSEDKLGDTIFPDVDETLDPNSYTYKLDKFLKENYLDKYNLTFLYKMADVSTNMNYNLVPATYDNSINLAVLCKHLWFDVYDQLAGEDFLKTYGPRIIHLIGSPAYNPQSGTEIVGLAEGGIKISLFKVNAMDVTDPDMMNEYYFKTMHHEFAHILHQTKTYPNQFNTISVGHYDINNWQDRHDGQTASLGFVSTYASSEFREDFAETIANYIVKTDAQWNRILELARRGWAAHEEDDGYTYYYCYYYYPNNDPTEEVKYISEWGFFTDVNEDGTVHRYFYDNEYNVIEVYEVADTDGVDGPDAILEKLNIARQWLKNEWNIDLDELRQEVQDRQSSYDINELRKQVTD